MIRRARYSSARSWPPLFAWFSLVLMLVMRPAAATALTNDVNQLT